MPDHAVLPIALPPVSRPVSAADVAYLEAVQHALLSHDHTVVRKWFCDTCPTCERMVPVGESSRLVFWEKHFVLARLVVIDCLGHWLINPAAVGVPEPAAGWVDWRAPAPEPWRPEPGGDDDIVQQFMATPTHATGHAAAAAAMHAARASV
ncbi:hypothetical protein [Actinomadura violacea]|uniref:Uncharacterized protein n=1 Tax=Actinomadura violacea TaxID=2819934 RepID=A0ABS3RZ66_9ACTN|nr:hypothetical protein [Actinomadura violacea]MBO2461588.1 hypothetical protein [Actinomadura violacea]